MVGVSVMALPPQAFQSQWLAAQDEASIDITDGLSNYWNPGTTLSSDDQVGSNDGNNQGGLTNSLINGWSMGTLDTRYVILDTAINNSTNYTVTCWIRPDKTVMDLNQYGGWIISNRGSSSPNQDFDLYYSKLTEQFLMRVFDSSGSFTEIVFTNAVADLTWQHLAVAVDSGASELRAYYNGQLDSTSTLTNVPNNGNTDAAIIGQYWGTDKTRLKYHGAFNDGRIYGSEAKNGTFIKALYDQTTDF